MEILNLDKFSSRRNFTHLGETYSIRGMKVKELEPFSNAMKSAKNDNDKMVVMVEYLTKMTNMTKDQLEDLEVGELTALISISQGEDPSKDSEGK